MDNYSIIDIYYLNILDWDHFLFTCGDPAVRVSIDFRRNDP